MSNNLPVPERIRELRKFQPSVIRNSLLMSLIQLLSFLGAFGLIGLSVWKLSVDYPTRHSQERDLEALTRFNLSLANSDMIEQTDKLIAYYLLFGSVLLLLVWKLTRMVLRRNAYILELTDALDGEE